MFKIKIFISIIIFSILLVGTSAIKNQTREIEKKILIISKKIHLMKKDLNESQLDYSYLTTPSMIEFKIENFSNIQYFPMKYSKIFLNLSNFLDLQNKIVKNENEKKAKK